MLSTPFSSIRRATALPSGVKWKPFQAAGPGTAKPTPQRGSAVIYRGGVFASASVLRSAIVFAYVREFGSPRGVYTAIVFPSEENAAALLMLSTAVPGVTS